jgi:hypothetical protein
MAYAMTVQRQQIHRQETRLEMLSSSILIAPHSGRANANVAREALYAVSFHRTFSMAIIAKQGPPVH